MENIESNRVAKYGGHRYGRGTVYVGAWNTKGKRQEEGHLELADGTRYGGYFDDGLFNGMGVLSFPDGSKYEGEFLEGWFHGSGIFWRSDGLVTFNDGTNGFPRNEGFFQDCKLVKKRRCPEAVQKAQKIAFMARTQFENAVN
ncbi:MORN repeat-containing protein 4 homolog isoform X2 [Agrilus planipennis]|uniref:MORN repeat-containing protein 4 homolog isoform X2 n=1 Tax=Agrilus planipennis TaxID=224129 RepID=A0A1W4XHV5_AGRPL|nr:MORN repeat-containing protein 4 homolog isoform X2 [Agrilus planipennis]